MEKPIEERFPEIERIIKGYDKENKVLSMDSVSIENYPKVFTLCSASVFEKRIKEKLNLFLVNPREPIVSSYPKIKKIIDKNPNNYIDKIFGKLKAFNDSNGIDTLDASEFYELFGGDIFKLTIAKAYEELREMQKTHANNQAEKMLDLISSGYKDCEEPYALLIDMVEQLDLCSFERAEESYLSIKLRRNKVAHNYMNDLLDSFNDLRLFYYGAALYITSVDSAISGLVSENESH